MKKVIFIVPYFGKLPNYFQVFLNSCEPNTGFKWVILTDDQTEYRWPENVQKINMSFSQLQQKIQNKFDFPICLPTPYKLCDYKPTYGYIFEDMLEGYPFWGYCDIDTIMGNLNDFLPINTLNRYDKLFELGHMTIFRNSFENNRLFMKSIHNKEAYKKVLSTEKIMIFDEVNSMSRININDIFRENNKKILATDYSFNVSVTPTAFVRVVYDAQKNSFVPKSRLKNQVVIWKKNNGIRLYFEKNQEVLYKNYLYIHLQQRKMNVKADSQSEILEIIPNEIISIPALPNSLSMLKKIKKRGVSFHRIRILWKWKISKKIKKLRGRK